MTTPRDPNETADLPPVPDATDPGSTGVHGSQLEADEGAMVRTASYASRTEPEGAGGSPRAVQGDQGAAGLGTIIAGRYTLVELIGEGGMGSVYLARQSEPVKRQVALKLVKTGMDSAAVLRRFEAERQALALIDPPTSPAFTTAA